MCYSAPSPLRPAKPSRVAGPPHPTPDSARVARTPRAQAKKSARRERSFLAVTLVCRSLKSGHSHSQNLLISPNRPGNCRKPTKPPSPLRGHSRPRLANRVGVMVAPSDAQCFRKRPVVAHLTPFSVSKSAILLTKSPSNTHSVSKWGILLTKSPSKTHSVSKTAVLLTEYLVGVLTTPLWRGGKHGHEAAGEKKARDRAAPSSSGYEEGK